MVCIQGRVKKRPYLIPRFSDVSPYLRPAVQRCEDSGIGVAIDEIPLCHLDGLEHHAANFFSTAPRGQTEKIRPASCASCTLESLCAGVRPEYLEFFGAGELQASAKDPAPIRARARRKAMGVPEFGRRGGPRWALRSRGTPGI